MATYEDRPHGWKRMGAVERWVKTGWFCLKCGAQDVWQSTEEGDDYYLGYSCTCKRCQHVQHCVDHWEEA